MKSREIRERFLKFFEKRGHKIIPSASLVPENDPSVLFNTAGMQPLVPYLLGQEHPMGQRIANIQKCVRTGDLEDIGDNRHFSFFEMMGNWSLGDPSTPDGVGRAGYFKEDAIKWSYDFLVNGDDKPEGDKGLGLDVNRLYVTVFEGDENAPFDEESKNIWMSLGVPENRIYALGAEDNWWSPGDNGPCGPCSEMFYDMVGTTGDLDKQGFIDAQKREDVIEIWNDVFMEYEKKDGKVIGKLAQKNVDTGAGLERITAVKQGKKTAYDTDLFILVKEILDMFIFPMFSNVDQHEYEKSSRIILDHLRTALMLASDGVIPSNKEQGYVMRRLIRRAVIRIQKYYKKDVHGVILPILDAYVQKYRDNYFEVENIKQQGFSVIRDEVEKFQNTLHGALKEFERISEGKTEISGSRALNLYTSHGLPIDSIIDLAKEKGMTVDVDSFAREFKIHQKLSQTASAGMFKGGLANHNEKTIRLHTAHHLLLKALQEVLGDAVKQRGSNITEERLRIDFVFDRKMTSEELEKVENLVNQKINEKLEVVRREMPFVEAEKIGAEMEFGAKYPENVSVYFIGPSASLQDDISGKPFSIEFCGGPHVKNTGELGVFKIQKEEASSAGVRRIKAVLL